jgi:hypothetical protein
MTRRQKIGILLLGSVPLIGIAFWMLGLTAFESGPAVIVDESSTPSSSEAVVLIPLTPNWEVLLPLVLLVVTGVACLLIPSRGRRE